MRSELSRISSFQSGFSGGKRALVVLFEYSKAGDLALTESEIVEILQATTNAASALGAVGVCQATLAALEPVELSDGEELVVRTELTLVKETLDSGDIEEEGGLE